MNPIDFKEARQKLGLSAAQLGTILDTDPRTIRRWESDVDPRPVNPIAARVLTWLVEGFRPPQWPS